MIYNGGTNANSITLQEVYPSTTTLNVSPSSASYGQSVALTATVSGSPNPGTPTGSVEFLQGSNLLGTVTLTNESAASTQPRCRLAQTRLRLSTSATPTLHLAHRPLARCR